MSNITRLAMLTAFLFLAIGCGTEPPANGTSNQNQTNNDEPDDPTELPDFSEANTDLVTAHCEKLFECCPTSDDRHTSLGLDVDTVEDCVELQSGIFGGVGGATMDVSFLSGRVTYSEGRKESCETRINELSCDEFQGTTEERQSLPGCRNMIEGTVEDGGDCMGDWECQSDICEFADDAADNEEGTCVAPSALGEDCEAGGCTALAYCDRFEERCHELRQDGDSCSENEMCISGYCGEIEVETDVYERECMEPTPACGG